MRAKRTLIAVVVAAVVATACTSFGSDPGSGTTSGDASAPNGGACSLAVEDPFTDLNAWTIGGDNLGGATIEKVGPAPPSAAVANSGNSDSSYLMREIDPGGCSKVVVAMNVQVDKWGAAEMDVFGVYEGPVDTGTRRGIILVHKEGTGTSLIAEAAGAPGASFTPTFAQFTRVEITLELAAKKWRMTVGNGASAAGDLPDAWHPGALQIRAGLEVFSSNTAPWTVRFDDLQVTGSP